MKLKNVSLTIRLALLAAVPVLGLVIAGYMANRISDHVRVGGEVYQEISDSKDLLADILPPPCYAIESYLAAHELTSETNVAHRNELLTELASLSKVFKERIEFWTNTLPAGELKASITGPAKESADALFTAINTKFVPLIRDNKLDAAGAMLKSDLQPLYYRHREAINTAVKFANATQEDISKRSAAEVQRGGTLMLGVFAGALGVSVVLCFFVARGIVKPVRNISGALREIAQGDGDLRRRIDCDDKSEIGALAANFNTFATKVHDIIRELRGVTIEVSTGAETISAATEEASRSMTVQQENVSQITTAIDELAESSQQVAARATSAHQNAELAQKVAREGDEVVQQTITSIRAIEAVVAEGAKRITQLGARSEQIGEIIRVINDIADQTNLLALNAAIEAARAGEHGRGFAVVADEVRKLAERTTQATKQVAEAISLIQTETTGAVTSMTEGTQQVRTGVTQAAAASEGLQKIVEAVKLTAGAISTITESAQQQAELGDRIRERVASITASAEEVGRANQSSAHATCELSDRSRKLTRVVEQFKLG